MDFFVNNAPPQVPTIEAEIRRYFFLSGRATFYKMGMLDVMRLRQFDETEMGDAFNIHKLNDEILCLGGLPFSLLERQVMDWVSANTVG